MSIKERLKSAYENVAFNADKTWLHNSHTYQRANQELYAKEYRLQMIKTVELRPRTVKDCIPKSKLAQYSNYEYNESRELSYAPSSPNFSSFLYYSRMPGNQLSIEPWLAPEVDDLFIRFSNYHHHLMDQFSSYNSYGNRNCCHHHEGPNLFTKKEPDHYEPPILNVDSFDSRILKMKITSDRIKNIWNLTDISVYNSSNCCQNRNDKTLNVYKTPAGIFFLRQDADNSEILTKRDFLRKLKMNDFEHLKYLSKSFKEQTSWVLKCTNRTVQSTTLILQEADIIEHDVSNKTDSSPTRRLYSAVLQGLPNNNNNSSNNNRPSPTKSDHFIPSLPEIIPNESLPVLLANSTKATQSKLELPPVCVLNSSVKNYPPPKTGLEQQSRTPPRVASPTVVINNNSNSNSGSGRVKLKPITTTSENCEGYGRSSVFSPMTICSNGISNCYTTTCVASPQIPCISTNCNYQFNLQCSNSYQSSCLVSNSLSTNMLQIVGSRGLQSISRQNYLSAAYQPATTPQMNVFPQNRTYFYPISQQYLQHQSYYCAPIVTAKPIPRWVPPNFARSALSQQTYPTSVPPHFIPQPPPHWITPNPQVVSGVSQYQDTQKLKNVVAKTALRSGKVPSVNILQNKTKSKTQVDQLEVIIENSDVKKIKKADAPSAAAAAATKTYSDEFDEVVNKTVNILFSEDVREELNSHVPVTPSSSEELEIQALEQYNNSTDNVYQELERQAEEQYEECSEN